MKALSLWQPWASALIAGTKAFETRGSVRSIPLSLIGKDLAIHAAKRPPRLAEIGEGFEDVCERITGHKWSDLPLGCVLGIAVPFRVYRTEELVRTDRRPTNEGVYEGMTELEIMLGNYEPGRIATRMGIVERFAEPIPAKGMQGIWEWVPIVYRLTGSDLDFIHFTTPSQTRVGVTHDLAVCKRTGAITCTCEDATCRKKQGDILDAGIEACKHVDGLHKEWRRLVAEGDRG